MYYTKNAFPPPWTTAHDTWRICQGTLFIRAHTHFNIHTTPPIRYHHPIPLSIHLHIHLPARTLAPVALNPPFHQLVHNLCAHHSYSINIRRFLCMHTLCGCAHLLHQKLPVRQPPDPPPTLASWHRSPGVLCALLEWPCWAPPPPVTGCMPPCILMQHF